MTHTDYELVIGDKRWSSWSLRPWLLMKRLDIPFRETLIGLRRPTSAEDIAAHSPSGRIPLLKAGGLVIWDSLAIAEFIAEEHQALPVWPADRKKRALARAVSAEMHSGFYSLRDKMPMDFLERHAPAPIEEAVGEDIRRIVSIWGTCRRESGQGGEFLFGAFSAADAMFAPVATRFRTYSVDLAEFGDDGTAAAYRETLLAMPEMSEWGEGAKREV
jgi:glutathione S-transferase